MNKMNLLNKLENSMNIYDFITIIYIHIDKNNYTQLRKEYYRNPSCEIFKEIKKLFKILDIDNEYEFPLWKKTWIQLITKSNVEVDIMAYYTLLVMDKKIAENDFSTSLLINRGRMSNIEGYSFYYRPPKKITDDYFNSTKIRRGRQTSEYDICTMNEELKNFFIIKSSYLFDYVPNVKLYSPKSKISTKLKIGIASLGTNKWFNVYCDGEARSLKIEYDLIDKNEHNVAIINILEEFDNKEASIVVFPELAINETTLIAVKNEILNKKFNHLKLIFLGSFYSEEKNKAIVINDKGKIILEQIKKVAYRQYDKKIEGYYSEDIQYGNDINLIDIDGIGRIAYLICAEYNHQSIKSVCSVMDANIVFVSAYSNSTDLMYKSAESEAGLRGVITILSNSCAAIGEKNSEEYTSFIVMPKVNKNRSLFADTINKNVVCESRNNCICEKYSRVSVVEYSIEKKS